MERTIVTSRNLEELEQQSVEDEYNQMTLTQLKKKMEEKKIEGRSKITRKADMIAMLRLVDSNVDEDEVKNFVSQKSSAPKSAKSKSKEKEPEEVKSTEEPIVLKHQYEPELAKILFVTKKIGAMLKSGAHESSENQEFKKVWLKYLLKIEKEMKSVSGVVE